MSEKKNEVITFRTEQWVKDELQRIADNNKWSIAQTANQIIMNFIMNPRPEKITIKAEDFINAARNIRAEGTSKGVEITIKPREDGKYLCYELIECSGLGQISGFEDIKEMTNDEITQLP